MNNEQLARKYFSVFGNNPVSIDEWDILVQQMRVPLQEENDKLKSVLKFVADEENFNENFYSYGYGSRSDYLKESGNRARELLKKLEDGKS